MEQLEALRARLPDAAKDVKLNVQNVLKESSLSPQQKWQVAVASAIAARNPELRDAVIAAAGAELSPQALDDAKAAAALMAMNNVYYRFRHFSGKDEYSQKPARLRMNRIAQPLAGKVDFELTCLAVSAINGCEACVRAHEKVVIDGGLTTDQVHDAVRIAATMHAAAVSLELGA